MISQNTLEAFDFKKIIEYSAYFLALYTVSFNLMFYLGPVFDIDVHNFVPPYLIGTITYSSMMYALVWGIARSFKAKYTSLGRTPLLPISILFILSVYCVNPDPTRSIQSTNDPTFITQKENASAQIREKWPQFARILMVLLLLMPVVAGHLTLALIPFWIMLRTGYLVVKAYFKGSQQPISD